MKRNTALTCLVSLLTLGFGAGSAQALATTPSFTISASNITLPSSGSGSIPFTLTSVNGYAGTVLISCPTVTPPAGVMEPYCEPPHFGPVPSYTLTASEPTVTGSIPITSLPEPAATASWLNRPGLEGTASWEVAAGALILGLGLRRRRARRFTYLLLAVGMLIGLAGLGACGSGSRNLGTLTPGTYTYTIKAFDQSVPQKSASTTVNVTVPPGIAVQ